MQQVFFLRFTPIHQLIEPWKSHHEHPYSATTAEKITCNMATVAQLFTVTLPVIHQVRIRNYHGTSLLRHPVKLPSHAGFLSLTKGVIHDNDFQNCCWIVYSFNVLLLFSLDPATCCLSSAFVILHLLCIRIVALLRTRASQLIIDNVEKDVASSRKRGKIEKKRKTQHGFHTRCRHVNINFDLRSLNFSWNMFLIKRTSCKSQPC